MEKKTVRNRIQELLASPDINQETKALVQIVGRLNAQVAGLRRNSKKAEKAVLDNPKSDLAQ